MLLLHPELCLYLICAIIIGCASLFVCYKCSTCKVRDCWCCKKFLRLTGHDQFDEFDFMMLVHKVTMDGTDKKRMHLVVKVKAGGHVVKTDAHCNGVFQQPLNITVEQGTRNITLELLDQRELRKPKLLATLEFNVLRDILQADLGQEVQYDMKEDRKSGVSGARAELTMVLSNESERSPIASLMGQGEGDVNILLQQQLAKAQKASEKATGVTSEVETLKVAGSGPLEIFEKLGKTKTVYCVVAGPPESRRWKLCFWNNEKECASQKAPIFEIELLKVESITPDPSRHHVFIINYFDDNRLRKSMGFRRVDRARDVWVELLHLLVQKARATKAESKLKATKTDRSQKSAGLW